MTRKDWLDVALHSCFYTGMLVVFAPTLELLPLSATPVALVPLLACIPLLYASSHASAESASSGVESPEE
jgi:hypothetical protein